MFNKKTIKIILTTVVLTISIIELLTTSAQAIYQSRPDGTPVTDNAATFLYNVRTMESSGQVMGLSATIDSTTLSDSTTPNNIDVHMAKPYEWTAVAILGRSGYGLGLDLLNNMPVSTTGNNYGIMDPAKQIEVARSVYNSAGAISGLPRYNTFKQFSNWTPKDYDSNWFITSSGATGSANNAKLLFGNNTLVFPTTGLNVGNAPFRAVVVTGEGR